MKTKRLLVVLLVGILSSSLLGCSGEVNMQNATDSNVETQEATAKKEAGYKKGMYKIGSDMPAGEYVIVSDSMTYMQLSSDSSGSLYSIIANDNFKNRSIITVAEGQYLEFDAGKAYPINEAPSATVSEGILEEGMYKIGLDIPAGEYKVISNGSFAYIEVASDSSHNLRSIVSNDNFEGEKYISVLDGQYLKFSEAKLIVNN